MKAIHLILVQMILIGAQAGVYVLAKNETTDLKMATLDKQYSDVIWEVDPTTVQKSEEVAENYVNTAKQDSYTFWHKEDRDLRVTIESEAMRLLLKEEYLVVKEGKDGEHLVLSVYFNPLKTSDPQPKDLVKTYEVIKYKKPAIMIEIEEEAELLANEEADTTCINADKQLFEAKYPFEESEIIKEEEEYIVYAKNLLSDEVLNVNFYQTYLDDSSVYGDYGWESFGNEDNEEVAVEE